MKLEIHSYKTDERPTDPTENFEEWKHVKVKTYECDTMDQDMKLSTKGVVLHRIMLDDVEIKCLSDIDHLMEFLRRSKTSFEK